MRARLLSFLAGLAVMAVAGLAWIDRPVDWRTASERDWPFGPRRTTVGVGEVVADIRPLNRLVVFRAYVAAITTTHEIGWVWRSDQTMITPAYVNYYVDMASLRPEAVHLNGGIVRIDMPRLMIERPNIDVAHVQVFNSGLPTALASTADRLRMKNDAMATRQLFMRADMPFLVEAANRAAHDAVTANVRNALVAKGLANLTVQVR